MLSTFCRWLLHIHNLANIQRLYDPSIIPYHIEAMLGYGDGRILGVDIDNVVSLTDPAIRKSIWEYYGIWLDQEQIVRYHCATSGKVGHIEDIM